MALGKKKSNGSGTSTKRITGRRTSPQFAVCINNDEYPASLERHKIYCIVPDKDAANDGDIRVVDESGEDYLYPEDWFVAIELPAAVKRSLRQGAKSG
jgi:hypothetical protein